MRSFSLWRQGAAVVAVAAFLMMTLSASAAGDETPDMQPFDPASATFFVHQSKDSECAIEAAQAAGTNYESRLLYATSVAADTCAQTDEARGASITIVTQSVTRDVHVLPLADQPIELIAGQPVTATVWVWTDNAGAISPRIALTTPDWTGEADAGARVTASDVEAGVGDRVWHRFDVDLGPAPAAFQPGAFTFTVDLDNGPDEQRRVSAIHAGLGVTPGHKSSFTLPLAVQVDEPGEPVVDWPSAIESAIVRPGVQHVTSGAQCTTNFVFRDLDSGKLYMGTAAHCVDNVGVGGTSRIQPVGSGSAIEATVVFSTYATPGLLGDFALMEIPADREKDVHPAVLHFGGPTGMADLGRVSPLDKVITYGNSGLRPGNTPLDWHEGYVTSRSTYYTDVYTVTPGIFGDSGSGVMTRDGLALGALSTIAIAPFPGENAFSNIPTTIDWMNDNGWNLQVQTWPLLDPGVLPGTFG